MMGEQENENYLRKYNRKNSPVPVRIPLKIIEQIPKPRSTWMRNVIIERIKSNNGIVEPKTSNESLKKSLIFLFKLFEKNAPNLEISELEREEIIKILEVLKSE